MSTSIGLVRWTLKKASRIVVAHGSRLLRRAHVDDSHSATVRVLTYHRFGDIPRDPFCLGPPQFAGQMRYIARAGLAVSLTQLEAFLRGKEKLQRDAVLITVDDGFSSLQKLALPILREYNIPAVAFVSVGKIEAERGDVSADAVPENYLAWRDLESLTRAGISIQSHGWSHRSLGGLSSNEVRDELCRSRGVLESRLGTRVSALAYPFGTRADFNADTAGLVRNSGYRLAFTAQHGPIRQNDEPFTLGRIKVESGETLATFAAMVRGGLDAWRWVDRSLWRLQSSR